MENAFHIVLFAALCYNEKQNRFSPYNLTEKKCDKMKHDLTSGRISTALLAFSGPMVAGNLLQQMYNLADTWIVGRCLGEQALAAVGSTYTLTTLLYSVIIGLCMGSGAVVSFYYGKKEEKQLRSCVGLSFFWIGAVAVVLEIAALCSVSGILHLLQIPGEILDMTRSYVTIILTGMLFTFFYQFYAYLLRALGNSAVPLLFLGIASVLNIVLDFLFVMYLKMGVSGAACATVAAQAFSGIGLAVYALVREPRLRFSLANLWPEKARVQMILRMTLGSSIQQSVMNFGILLVQGRINSFGTTVMAAFAVAVKIDTLAYMPAQEFANAYSLFISQNFGAGKQERIRRGTKAAAWTSGLFCSAVSVLVVVFARQLMQCFVERSQTDVIAVGMQYLRTEGAFYLGIGILFLLYGYFRGVNRPEMALLLTVISLGTRVVLAYLLSAVHTIGVFGIWIAIPIGWLLADAVGCFYIRKGGVWNHDTKHISGR